MLKILKWFFSVEGSQIFFNLSAGLGTFFAGLAGWKIVMDWMKELKRKRRIESYKRLYPRDQENPTGWELAYHPQHTREIHLLDHRNSTYQWIANGETFRDLELREPQRDDPRKTTLFTTYQEIKENIITTGKPYR